MALWLLAVGFAAMCVWRLTEAAFGAAEDDGDKATTRLASLGRAVIYGFIDFGVLKYAIGVGGPKSSDQQSVDLTATAMRHPGGRVAVIVVGVVLAASGLAMAWSAARTKFLKKMNTGDMSPRTRQVVTWIGRIGGVARGVIFVTSGSSSSSRPPTSAAAGQGGRLGPASPGPDPAGPVAAAGGGHRAGPVRRLLLLRGPLAQGPARPPARADALTAASPPASRPPFPRALSLWPELG